MRRPIFAVLCLTLWSGVLAAQRNAPPPDALPERPVLEVTLGDLKEPQVFEVKQKRYNLKIRQEGTPRAVKVRAFFGKLESPRHPGWRPEVEVSAATATMIGVIPDPNAPVMYVVFTDASTRDTSPLVVGAKPTADDTLQAWELRPRMLMMPNHESVALALTPEQLSTAWLGLDEAWFVFSQSKTCGGKVEAGEPLLVLSTKVHRADRRDRGRVVGAQVLRANGATVVCHGDALNALLARRPAAITMPEPFVKNTTPEDFWKDEDFLADFDTDPAVRKFAKKKKAAWACAEKQWKKLDPDGRAGQYDVVTHRADGNVENVESLWHRTQRKVWARCKIKPIERQRERLNTKHNDKGIAQSREHLAKVAARFAAKAP